MFTKHLIITIIVTLALIVGCALGLAFYRHDVSSQSVIEYVWGVSFAFAAIGFLFRGGAATGDTVERAEGVRKTSQNFDAYVQADNDDAKVGFAFGTVVMLSSLGVFVVSFAILHAFFRQ